jgi:hypothetical protein
MYALEADSRVVASALDSVRRGRGMSYAELAAYLDMPLGRLPRLALCRRPGDVAARAEVARVALYAGCAPQRLSELLREAGKLAERAAGGSAATQAGEPAA